MYHSLRDGEQNLDKIVCCAMFLHFSHEIEIREKPFFSRKLNFSYKCGCQCQWQHQFCESIAMNNILFVSIGLLAVTAMVCAYRPLVNYGGDAPMPMHGGQPAGIHVSQTESKSNFWSRTISRQRREAPPPPGGPGGPKVLRHDVLYVFESERCEFL